MTSLNASPNVIVARSCAKTPPTLLQPAIQPVARPRELTGRLSDVWGNRIKITAVIPMTKSDTGHASSIANISTRFVPQSKHLVARRRHVFTKYLSAVNDRYVGGFSRFLLFASGKTQLNAILSALFTIFMMSFLFIVVMSGGVKLMFAAVGGAGSDMRLLALLQGSSFNELLLVAHAAFLGSVVSIMSRIKAFLADASLTPLMMYVSVVTRPIVSVLVSVLVFCTIKSGMLSFHGIDFDGPNGYYIAWGIGFLCGFSERLAQNFVVAAGGTLETPAPATLSSTPRS